MSLLTAPPVKLSTLIGPHDRQLEYLRATDRYKYTLYGGARGGGKSYIERWRQVRFLLNLTAKGLRNVRTGLFCNTYDEVRKRQVIPAKNEFPSWLGRMNEGDLEFRFAGKYGGHTIAFCNLKDVDQHKSDQFATIGIEELTLLPSWEIVTKLSGSLRWPNVDWSPMGFTTNPDGPMHSTVKGLFVEKDLFDHPDYADLDPDSFHFVRALPGDNEHLPQSYIDEVLSKLPESLRKPWLEGSWDLFEGQRFRLNPRVHVVDPFDWSELDVLPNFYGAMDYGFDNPMAFGLYMTLHDSDRDSDTWCYKIMELNRSGLNHREQARLVVATLKEMGIKLREPVWLDSQCWELLDDGLSIADKFEEEGLEVQQALKPRPAGWVAVERLLDYEHAHGDPKTITRQPQMKIFRNCVHTIKQITDALWDPKKPGDIQHPESFRDDSLDETRYFALNHHRAPREEPPPDPWAHQKRVAAAIEQGY